MISRKLGKNLLELAGHYPVVVVTGPRQSGKTTLCRASFPEHAYVSLEALDTREFATSDPRGFLAQYANGVIIDEIQQAAGLLSYLQTEVDTTPEPGRFILTGSEHFTLSQAITQSLAGRCGILTLLPPDFEELQQFENAPRSLSETLLQGSYPRIYDRSIPAAQWLRDYTYTYIERDVRQVLNIGNLQGFTLFLRLAAGRTSQELNLSSLGGDAGITHNTAKAWLKILETSHLISLLPAWHANIRKQLIKTPKLHFLDSGVICSLLGINTSEQLMLHPLRGAIFESWVYSEILKHTLNAGEQAPFYYYRESRGLEMDLLVQEADHFKAVEIKSGATPSSDFFKHFATLEERFSVVHPSAIKPCVVYGGDTSQQRSNGRLLGWRDVHALFD